MTTVCHVGRSRAPGAQPFLFADLFIAVREALPETDGTLLRQRESCEEGRARGARVSPARRATHRRREEPLHHLHGHLDSVSRQLDDYVQ